ncbi:hypothetical protein B7P43_G05140 [Cryptotermes secundus]|uniref:RNA-directed DNA polymerase n=2 Tax=Cryptotermes secundus TaxID=105785 RepID=A0A2J7PEY0_9NEOP|nr:hypothetical protein B7P43_G05140 [Cryptotermes secundus]
MTLGVDLSKTNELKFLIDTGAEISLVRSSSLKPEVEISCSEGINVKGISNTIMRTKGTTELRLFAGPYETTHTFHVMNDNFQWQYDGILGRDFWIDKGANINYCDRRITMDNVAVEFDPNVRDKDRQTKITLKARTENLVRLPTPSKGQGLISKKELIPGVYLAESLSTEINGTCVTSIINSLETDVTIEPPVVVLEDIDNDECEKTVIIFTTQLAEDNDRLAKLRNELRTDHLNSEERVSLIKICEEYNDVFHLPGDKLTFTTAAEHAIPTPAINPNRAINTRSYRIPEVHKEEVQRQTEQMLQDGIIAPSNSPWNSPILVVPKKADASGKKKWRIVVDFRKLNDVTIGDSFPIPVISEVLDALGNSRYFSTIDCASGFLQVPVKQEDQAKTAFSTPQGHYEYKRMPFGLKGAPSTFQRLMNSVLTGIQGIKCLVYLDDIVVFGESLQIHNNKLRDVLDRMREHNLKLQPDKCEFLRKEVSYLGHIITSEGVKPDERKVEVVKNFPTPTTTQKLKGFLGLAGYYRRFIPNFSKIAKPLTELLKKNTPYIWNEKTETAFNALKESLSTEPILQYPDFKRPFVLTTDASNEAIGAVLSQGPIGRDLPVAYASRTLIVAERNYPTIEKELLAIVWACKYFRPYLYGRKFTIVTDHRPLTWIFSVKDPSSRLLRWRLKLEEYDYQVVYKKGSKNTNADALSRIQVAEISPDDKEQRIEITQDEKQKIFQEMHEKPTGGHLGMNRTYDRIKLFTSWPGMKQELEDYIRRCEICQRNKITQNKTKMPLQITTTPDVVWEKCSLDIVGPLTLTLEGNKYLLTFQDELSKYTIAIPIQQQDAETVAKAFVEEIVLKFGIPQTILTDQGSNFLSELFANICKLLKIKKIKTTAYHPQSNGALERTHRVLVEYLRCFILEDQTNWDQWISYATFVFNTTPHTATGFTPHELLFGRKPNVPGILQKEPPEVLYTYDNYVKELQSRLQSSYDLAKNNLIAKKERSKEYHDKNVNVPLFTVGDKVLLHDEKVRRGRSLKLSPPWIGPYEVTEVEDVNVTLKLPRNRTLKVHANRLKPFFD